MDISIIIPVRNGVAPGLRECLAGIFSQKTNRSFEVIVIDSGSTDGTVDILKAEPRIKLIEIPAAEFGHGKTRNLGAKEAQGDILVFVNADVWPADENWLESLVSGFASDPTLAGTFSRQLPKPGCPLFMERDLLRTMPDRKIVRDQLGQFDFMSFSTVSAAMPRSVWQQVPFDDGIDYAEDQDWAKKILALGRKISLEPASRAYHSHNYSFSEFFDIKVRTGRVFRTMKGSRIRPLWDLVLSAGLLVVRVAGDTPFILGYKGMTVPAKLEQLRTSLVMRTASSSGRYWGSVTS